MTVTEKTVEFIVAGEDAKKLLECIGDSLSNIQSRPLEYVAIDFSKLKKLTLRFKTELGQPCVKARVYVRDAEISGLPDAPQTAGDKPVFRVLKKRLNVIFKIIGARLSAGELPSRIETDLFCRTAERMTTYPGYEDPMHDVFLKIVGEFENAFHRFNIVECREKYDVIRTMKTRCHNVLPP